MALSGRASQQAVEILEVQRLVQLLLRSPSKIGMVATSTAAGEGEGAIGLD
jgi:hypothetical protein